jgi:hypothetical protein
LIRQTLARAAVAAALLGGVAITWTAAAFGCQLVRPPGCGRPLKAAILRARELRASVVMYQIEHHGCPTRDDLLTGNYLRSGTLVDPWGTSVTFHCLPEGDAIVRSAGPDRLFNTADDITDDQP